MEKKPPPLPASKFKFFYFLPKSVMLSPEEPSPARTPSPRPKKKRTSSAVHLRSASTRVKIGRSFRFREPRSPRVSCIGNVASKGDRGKKERRRNNRRGKERWNAVAAPRSNQSLVLKLLKVFKKKETKAANRNAEPYHLPPGGACEKSAPKTGHVKKLFNWGGRGSSSAVAPHPPSSISKRRWGKRKEVAVVEDIVLVPRKEINLWKKRMVAPPPPLAV